MTLEDWRLRIAALPGYTRIYPPHGREIAGGGKWYAEFAGDNRRRMVIMKAIWRGRVIAKSDRTLEVGGYRYFPRETVRMDLLRAAPRTEDDLDCPHGVQFYDLVEGGACTERAAWSYEAPRASMTQVDHWVGFWEDVEIE
jgi:uncharacterized protein (DUF427 family)